MTGGFDGDSLSGSRHTEVSGAVFRSAKLTVLLTVVGCVAGLVIGTVIQGARGDSYRAEAVVVASQTPLPIEDFGELGVALFRTDTVLNPVINELNLDVTPDSLLSGDHLEVEPVPNAIAIEIIARDSDPQLAQDLVNAVAESFASALTSREMGTFEVFEDDDVAPISPQTAADAALLGAVLGFVGGATLSLLRILITQPILSREEALEILPADMTFSALVRLPFAIPFTKRPDSAAEIVPHNLVPAISRAATEDDEGPRRPCFVLAERSKRGDRSVRALLKEMKVVGLPRRISHARKAGYWVQTNDERLAKAVELSDVTVALISEGVSRRSLRYLSEEMLAVPGRSLDILVFVRSRLGGLTQTINPLRLSRLLQHIWSALHGRRRSLGAEEMLAHNPTRDQPAPSRQIAPSVELTESQALRKLKSLLEQRDLAFEQRDPALLNGLYTSSSPVSEMARSQIQQLLDTDVLDQSKFHTLLTDVLEMGDHVVRIRQVVRIQRHYVSENGRDITRNRELIRQQVIWTLRLEDQDWRIHDSMIESSEQLKAPNKSSIVEGD